jgi:hypothetical protein
MARNRNFAEKARIGKARANTPAIQRPARGESKWCPHCGGTGENDSCSKPCFRCGGLKTTPTIMGRLTGKGPRNGGKASKGRRPAPKPKITNHPDKKDKPSNGKRWRDDDNDNVCRGEGCDGKHTGDCEADQEDEEEEE